jgi:hypothetical protein
VKRATRRDREAADAAKWARWHRDVPRTRQGPPLPVDEFPISPEANWLENLIKRKIDHNGELPEESLESREWNPHTCRERGSFGGRFQ